MKPIVTALTLGLFIATPAAADEAFIYRGLDTEVFPVPSVTESPIGYVPSTLIIEPGVYEWNGKIYDLTEGGVYRFIIPQVADAQRIVWNGNVDHFMSGIAWLTSHGNAHDTFTDKSAVAIDRKLVVTCGPLSEWALSLATSVGIQARFVWTMTLDELNSYDNGHSMVEVFHPVHDKWVVYDLTSNVVPMQNGVPLSFYEFRQAVVNDDPYDLKEIAADTSMDIATFQNPSTGFYYQLIMEQIAADPKAWYKRAIQVPIIRVGSQDYFTASTADQALAQQRLPGAQYLTEQQFLDQFYP